MNWIVFALLAVLAFFLIQEELMFLGFLVVIAMAMVAFYKPAPQEIPAGAQALAAGHAAPAHREPYTVKIKSGKIPSSFYVRIYPTWENRNIWEEMGKWGLGVPLNTLGGTLQRLVTGKHSEAGTELEPELLMRGR